MTQLKTFVNRETNRKGKQKDRAWHSSRSLSTHSIKRG